MTVSLSERQAQDLIDATRFAASTGLAFNRMTTVHWEAAGVADPPRAIATFITALRKSIAEVGGPFAYVWVRENGPGKGEHWHLLWHGPKRVPLLRRSRRLLAACGAKRRADICLTRSIGRALSRAESGDDDYLVNLDEALDYVLKTANDAARKRLGIKRRESGGPIIGRRSCASQNIGPAARAKKGSE